MILLTKLDGHTIAVNDAQIVFAESTPDTLLTMASGQRMLVRESLAELMGRVAVFRRSTAPGESHG